MQLNNSSYSFTNVAVDAFYFEYFNVVNVISKNIDGACYYLGSVDNTHCANNDRCQLIGGACPASISDSFIGTFFVQVAASKYLVALKDFVSDKKVGIKLS